MEAAVDASHHCGYKACQCFEVGCVAHLDRRMGVSGGEAHFKAGNALLLQLQIGRVRYNAKGGKALQRNAVIGGALLVRFVSSSCFSSSSDSLENSPEISIDLIPSFLSFAKTSLFEFIVGIFSIPRNFNMAVIL